MGSQGSKQFRQRRKASKDLAKSRELRRGIHNKWGMYGQPSTYSADNEEQHDPEVQADSYDDEEESGPRSNIGVQTNSPPRTRSIGVQTNSPPRTRSIGVQTDFTDDDDEKADSSSDDKGEDSKPRRALDKGKAIQYDSDSDPDKSSESSYHSAELHLSRSERLEIKMREFFTPSSDY